MTTYEVLGKEIEVYDKTPNEEFDVIVDFSEALGADSISSAASIVSPSGELVVLQTSNDSTKAQVFLDAGVVDKQYEVIVSIVSANAPPRKFDKSFFVRIVPTT